jgi:hypothetical protein
MDNNSIQKYKNHHKAHFHEIDSVFFNPKHPPSWYLKGGLDPLQKSKHPPSIATLWVFAPVYFKL